MSAAIQEAESSLSLRDHLVRIGLWTIVSLNIGAYFSQGDEGVQVLLHLDEFSDLPSPFSQADAAERARQTVGDEEPSEPAEEKSRTVSSLAADSAIRCRALTVVSCPGLEGESCSALCGEEG